MEPPVFFFVLYGIELCNVLISKDKELPCRN